LRTLLNKVQEKYLFMGGVRGFITFQRLHM